jgi:hypothetical protein
VIGRPAARAGAIALGAISAVIVLLVPLAAADSFTPVRLTITVAPIARLHVPLRITVGVNADPGVLDGSEGPLRIEAKLAGECGGAFQTTPGDTLLDKQLAPQPATGRAYTVSATGAGKPSAYGTQLVCVYLEDTRVGRVYANDETLQATVSKPCTIAAKAYDSARRRLRHARRAAVRRRLARTVARDRARAARACGPGVAL